MPATRIMVQKWPFTLAFLGTMIAANVLVGMGFGPLPGEVLERFGLSLSSVMAGEVWRLLTAVFLSHDGGMFLRQLAFAALELGAAEAVMGTRRAAITFIAIDLLGSVLLLIMFIAPVSGLPDPAYAAIATRHDVGMSAGGFGLLGALIADWKWQWAGFVALTAALLAKLVFWPDPIADSAHLLTLAMGFGWQLMRPRHALKKVDE